MKTCFMSHVTCYIRCFPCVYCGKRRFSIITVYVTIHMLLAVMSTPVFLLNTYEN